MTPQEQKRLRFIRLFKEFNAVSSSIQYDMARVLLTDENNRNELSKQLKENENQMEIRMNKAVHAFIGVMPLATMNHCNLFGKVLALHSNLTGDPLMHDTYDEVNRQTIEEMDCN